MTLIDETAFRQGIRRVDADREWAFREVASSCRQKIFQSVLNGETSSQLTMESEETPDLHQEMNLFRTMERGTTGSRDQIRTMIRKKIPKVGLQPLVTAAYIQAAALAGSRALLMPPDMPAGSLVSSKPSVAPQIESFSSTRANQESGQKVQGERGLHTGETGLRFGLSTGKENLGVLSATFESGDRGVGAIGYDCRGGTSYGLFQMSSKAGTVDRFIDFLARRAPRWARRLREAGPADTGGSRGAMPRVWKEIAAEDPEGFAQLQRDFVSKDHYGPAVREIERATGIRIGERSRALQEVVWSIAVQHGVKGARRIVSQALDQLVRQGKHVNDRSLIETIYKVRTRWGRVFSRSIRKALLERYRRERSLALALLEGGTPTTERA